MQEYLLVIWIYDRICILCKDISASNLLVISFLIGNISKKGIHQRHPEMSYHIHEISKLCIHERYPWLVIHLISYYIHACPNRISTQNIPSISTRSIQNISHCIYSYPNVISMTDIAHDILMHIQKLLRFQYLQ